VKASLNFVAYAWGPHVAREARFVHARRFALGQTEEANGLQVRLLDSKLDDELGAVCCKPDHHAIILSGGTDHVGTKVFLYQRQVAVVMLSTTTYAADRWTVGLFDYRRRVDRLVDESTMKDPFEDWLA